MNSVSLLRFVGARSAWGVYGAPTLAAMRVSRSTLVMLGFAALVFALYAAGIVHFDHGAFVLGAGTVAAAKREEALAELKAARDLVNAETGDVDAENEDAYQAHLTKFRELDKAATKAAEREDEIGTLEERWAYYTGKATGTPMRFQQAQLDPASPKSLGEQFVESKAYHSLKESGALTSPNSRFRSDPVIAMPGLGRFGAAATDVIQTESGGPAAIVRNYRLPDMVGLQQRPLTIRDLFANETMPEGDTIEYAAQTGFDNAAAAVAQATTTSNGAKPQSSIAWQLKTARAEWIATWMAATRQALADESQLRSLIDNQGRLMVALEEEDQLVNGDGSSPNISGILDQSGLQTLDVSHLGDNANLTAIRTARRLVKTGTSRLQPTFVIVNPVDSEEFDLMQDLEGRFRAGDPFATGGGQDSPPIWKLQRVESEAVSAGTAIVGARAAATIFDRQPITVLVADQHSDFFVRNLVVILFEERIAFPVYFPTGFVEVTLDAWSAGS